MKTLARVGYGAKGIVYIITGGLAAQGIAQAGSEGALTTIAQQPFGKVLLGLVAVGLAAYSLWRFVQGFTDPENEGDDAEGIGKRVGYLGSAAAYAFLTFTAVQIIFSGSSGSGSGGGGWTAQLLQTTWGQIAVGAVGVGILIGGFYQLYQGFTGGFTDDFAKGEMSSQELTWATRAGRIGHIARGIVYLIIAWFFVQAALQSDASETGGIGKALDELGSQPYGPWLLGAVGVGFVAYGIYCFVMARYRKDVY